MCSGFASGRRGSPQAHRCACGELARIPASHPLELFRRPLAAFEEPQRVCFLRISPLGAWMLELAISQAKMAATETINTGCLVGVTLDPDVRRLHSPVIACICGLK